MANCERAAFCCLPGHVAHGWSLDAIDRWRDPAGVSWHVDYEEDVESCGKKGDPESNN